VAVSVAVPVVHGCRATPRVRPRGAAGALVRVLVPPLASHRRDADGRGRGVAVGRLLALLRRGAPGGPGRVVRALRRSASAGLRSRWIRWGSGRTA